MDHGKVISFIYSTSKQIKKRNKEEKIHLPNVLYIDALPICTLWKLPPLMIND